ncbi:extracellular matrix protein FRAS1 isoform X1 [Lates japonicus]|uniref:Extracellular matrix protein FRAS1 isoform X1 n=1 Tax=Lates japonicus TaxID=270547 RepID=A0AAD3RAU7_LATJO|nr:extracellular matrix protein FRAS1 isoform X1 [Lates japonicus]
MGGWWIFVGALAGILTVPRGIYGACIYEGSLHAVAEKMCLIYNACRIPTLWMIMAMREHDAARLGSAQLLKKEPLTPAAPPD